MTPPWNGPGGSLVTYAQNREDLYLYALVGDRVNGTYVDVGCNHERLHSVTRLFYELGWRGLNIDANPAFGAEYAAARPDDAFLNVGIGEHDGALTFRVYPEHDGLSTFDPGTMEVHAPWPYPHRDVVVPVRTLADVLHEAGIDLIDFLKIDVEGLEGSVLRGLDFTAVAPSVIVVEASRRGECEAVLVPRGYHREMFDGLNDYYVSADDAAAGVTMHNYAGRVLARPVYSAREAELMSGHSTWPFLVQRARTLASRSAAALRRARRAVRARMR